MADQTQDSGNTLSDFDPNVMDLGTRVPVKSLPPLNAYRQQFPQFGQIPDDRVLEAMHKEMAPDLEYPRFENLARQTDGYDAIQKAKANLTDVEKFRVQFPQFKDVPRERILDQMYKQRVSDKRVDPTLISRDEFRHQVDPLPGPLNDLWNLWESAKVNSSIDVHKFNEGMTGGWPKWFGDMSQELLNKVPTFSIDSKTGKLTPSSSVGAETKKLGDQVQDWINTNTPGFTYVWQKWHEILSAMTMTPEQQAKFAAIDQQRLANVPEGLPKAAGQLASVGTDLILNAPVYATLGPEVQAAKVLPVLLKKTAALVTIAHGAASGYHEAQEAHSENALLSGATAGFSTAALGYLYNSGAGRVLTGLSQAIIGMDPNELEKQFNGQETDHTKFAANTILNLGLGLMVKGRVHEGLTELRGPTAEEMERGAQPPISLEFAEKGHRILKQSEVLSEDPWALLGGKEPEYPSKVRGLSPIRIIERKERPVTVASDETELLSAASLQTEADTLIRGRPLTRQVPTEGREGATRLITHKTAAAIESVPELVSGHQLEGSLQEAKETPDLLQTDERKVRRVIGVRHGPQASILMEPEAWEHVLKAIDAREAGDIPKALSEVDTAISLSDEQQATQLAKDFAKAVRGESEIWTPKEQKSDEPEPEEWAQFDEEAGVRPHKIAQSSGEHGWEVEIALPDGRRQKFLSKGYPYDDPEVNRKLAEYGANITNIKNLGPGVRRVPRGEMGSVINPAELILHAAKKVGDLYDDYFKRGLFATERREEAAALIRPVDIKLQSDEHVRDQLEVHQSLNPWGTQSALRRNRWNAFNNDELKNILIEYSRGNLRPTVSDPKKQSRVNYQLYRNNQAESAAARAMTGFGIEPQAWYVRSMVSDNFGQVKKFDAWVINWKADHNGVHPTFEDAMRAKTPNGNPMFTWKSYNPEDWLQAKLNTARNILARQDAFNTFREAGRAIPVKELLKPRTDMDQGLLSFEPERDDFHKVLTKYKWREHTAPDGNKYYVEPETWHVMQRYFDEHSAFTIPGLKYYQKFAMMRKNVTGNILSWSLVHPKHIWEIHVAHVLAQMQTGVPAAEGWKAMAPKMPSDRVVDYFQEKIPKSQLSPEDLVWVDRAQRAGLTAGINSERQMQLEFGRNLAQFLRRGHTLLRGGDRVASIIGGKFLQNEWVQRMIFGEYIPRLKMVGFKVAVRRLLLEHPEFEQDHNKLEFDKALAQIGNTIDDRYGERNMANLLWPRVVKELGVSHLLSMGWNLGFLNVTGGAVKDYATSVTRMQNIFRSVSDPKRRPVITERMHFFNNYAGAYLLSGLAFTLLYGYSQGKKFDPKDLVYPVTGQNNEFPLDDPRHWTRSRPVEFQSELLTILEHINKEGGAIDHPIMAPLYGVGAFAQNKVNPGLRDLADALWVQHDFFGRDIGGRPLEPEWDKIQDKIGYILFNDNTPIVVKQQIEGRLGHPAPKTFDEYMKNLATLDVIPAILGYPRAPEYVYRTGFENAVVNAYSYGRSRVKTEEMIEKSNWINELRTAEENHDKKRAEEAIKTLEDKYKVKRGEIKKIAREGLRGESAAMYMFFHGDFSEEEQKKLLQKATPQEKADWIRKASKGEAAVLAKLGVQ